MGYEIVAYEILTHVPKDFMY